jgi:hypothetical protein
MVLRPAWATVGTGRLAALPPIPGVKHLIVLTDNDVPGREAARRCAQTASNAGCTATLLTPIAENSDFNDLVHARAT